MATLAGNSDPTGAGNYDYNAQELIILAPDTTYWVRARGSVAGMDQTTYRWNFVSGDTGTVHTGPGTLELAAGSGDSGSTWTTFANEPNIMSVEGNVVVPEPASWGRLAGLGLLGFALWRRARPAVTKS